MTERTNDEVRRAIAEALGWRCEVTEGGGRKLIRPGQSPLYAKWQADLAEKMFWDEVPDWPNDPGAALALCLEIARERGWTLFQQPVRIGVVCWFADPDTDQVFPPYHTSQFPGVYADEPAEALARLALAGIEAQAVSDE